MKGRVPNLTLTIIDGADHITAAGKEITKSTLKQFLKNKANR